MVLDAALTTVDIALTAVESDGTRLCQREGSLTTVDVAVTAVAPMQCLQEWSVRARLKR